MASFGLAAIISWYSPLTHYRMVGDMGLRVGLVLGAFWLAWPDLHRLPHWTWYILPIAFVVLIYARVYLIFLIPLFAVATFLYILYRRIRRKGSER